MGYVSFREGTFLRMMFLFLSFLDLKFQKGLMFEPLLAFSIMLIFVNLPVVIWQLVFPLMRSVAVSIHLQHS